MKSVRFWILCAGPLPIVWASIALSHWVKPDRAAPTTVNEVKTGATAALQAPQPKDSGSSHAQRLAAECAARAEALQRRIGPECAVIARSPFILAGDIGVDQLERWREKTILPAQHAMDRAYFDRSPDQPVTILLFRDETSYNAYTERLFGERGVSVYGYYKPQQRTLVLNIATGGGTLTHELTHALLDFDFPSAPDWFNEGLASLHEQCRIADDGARIEGLENWRLPALQEAAAAGRLRSLRALMEDDDFRGAQMVLNYAHARYFCLYLQRQQKLEKFYRLFRERHAIDPTGVEVVTQVFEGQSWNEIDANFQAWILQLKGSG